MHSTRIRCFSCYYFFIPSFAFIQWTDPDLDNNGIMKHSMELPVVLILNYIFDLFVIFNPTFVYLFLSLSIAYPQLKFGRHTWVHNLFLNMWAEGNHSRQCNATSFCQPSFYQIKPPLTKNLLMPHNCFCTYSSTHTSLLNLSCVSIVTILCVARYRTLGWLRNKWNL